MTLLWFGSERNDEAQLCSVSRRYHDEEGAGKVTCIRTIANTKHTLR